MSLELNARQWWECSGDELWAMNLRRPNFVAQDDECHRRSGNQALPIADAEGLWTILFFVKSR